MPDPGQLVPERAEYQQEAEAVWRRRIKKRHETERMAHSRTEAPPHSGSSQGAQRVPFGEPGRISPEPWAKPSLVISQPRMGSSLASQRNGRARSAPQLAVNAMIRSRRQGRHVEERVDATDPALGVIASVRS